MKYKYLLALSVLLSFSCIGNAQVADAVTPLRHPEAFVAKQDSALKAKHQRNKYFYLDFSLGYDPPFFSFPVYYNTDDEYFSDVTPIYNVSTGIDFLRFLNAGLSFTYQEATFTQTSAYSTDDLTMLNTSAHVCAHINKHRESFDHYIGIRAGYSYLTDQPTSTQYSSQYSPPTIYALNGPSEYRFAYQLFYGVTFYSENVGFNLELGLGSPFLIKGGISVRLGLKRNKKVI